MPTDICLSNGEIKVRGVANRLWHSPRQPRWIGWLYLVVGLVALVPRIVYRREVDALAVSGFLLGLMFLAGAASILLAGRSPTVAQGLGLVRLLLAIAVVVLGVVALVTRD